MTAAGGVISSAGFGGAGGSGGEMTSAGVRGFGAAAGPCVALAACSLTGTVKAPFDASELMLLTYELRKPQYRFSDTDIRKIAGENLYGFLLKVLPD